MLKDDGFTDATGDGCLLTKQTTTGPVHICLSMDDFLVASPDRTRIDEFHELLKSKYNVKELGNPTSYLGWNVTHAPNGAVHIFQSSFVHTVLERHQMTGCRPTKSPLPYRANLAVPEGTPTLPDERAQEFRSIIGDLRYLADSTCPDIAHATSRLAKHMCAPTNHHLALALHVLRYLAGTTDLGLSYEAHANNVVVT